MSDRDTARWTVSVSRDTDAALRQFLTLRGMTDQDLPAFIEDAVKWRLLEQTLEEARSGFADLSPDGIVALVEEAVTSVRVDNRAPNTKAG